MSPGSRSGPAAPLPRSLAATAPLLGLVLLTLALSPTVRAAGFSIEKSAFRVSQPSKVAGTFESAIGDFGVPLYGGKLTGRLGYVPENANGCANFTSAQLTGTDIVLVVRGGCYFVEKAWNAQQAGAHAVVVYDNRDEGLITMATPENVPRVVALVPKITVPTVLVSRSTGEGLRDAAVEAKRSPSDPAAAVVATLDWRESIVHPDDRVEYALWFTTDSSCGATCGTIASFLSAFGETGQGLEMEGFAQFTPHITLGPCPPWYGASECAEACVRGSRYCATSSLPQEAALSGYRARDVVEQDLRSVCVHRSLNATGQSWKWFAYARRFASRCTIAGKTYDAKCAEEQMAAVGVDIAAAEHCLGDLSLDQPLEIADLEILEQAGEGRDAASSILMMPTMVVNRDQYRGLLSPSGVLRALCAGFSEHTEPPLCLSSALNYDECTAGTDDCWKADGGFTACVDTFRGFTCKCPQGWEGDGRACVDIDECATNLHNCDQVCTNTPGSFKCACRSGYRLVGGGGNGTPGVCISTSVSAGGAGFILTLLVTSAFVTLASVGGILVYRWRTQGQMQSEIRAIMRDYMPLADDPAASARGGANGSAGRAAFDGHGVGAGPSTASAASKYGFGGGASRPPLASQASEEESPLYGGDAEAGLELGDHVPRDNGRPGPL